MWKHEKDESHDKSLIVWNTFLRLNWQWQGRYSVGQPWNSFSTWCDLWSRQWPLALFRNMHSATYLKQTFSSKKNLTKTLLYSKQYTRMTVTKTNIVEFQFFKLYYFLHCTSSWWLGFKRYFKRSSISRAVTESKQISKH